MLAKIAAVIALLLTALTAPVVNPQPEPAGYPEPATAAPYSMGDAPAAEQPTATPVTLPTPGARLVPTAQPGYQLVCLHITRTELAGGGVYAECTEYGYTPILPTLTAAPQEGYPLP